MFLRITQCTHTYRFYVYVVSHAILYNIYSKICSYFAGVRKRRQVGKDVSQAHDKEQLVSVEVPGSVWDRFVSYLTAPTDPSNLAILRIMYGEISSFISTNISDSYQLLIKY